MQLSEFDLLVKIEPSWSFAKTASTPPWVVVNGEVIVRLKLTVPDLPEMSTVTSLFSTFPAGFASEPLFGVR